MSDGGAAQTRVGEVATIIRGVTYSKKDASTRPGERRMALLRSGNLRDEIDLNDLVYVPQELVRSEQNLRPGDIVVSSSNSVDLVGKSAQVRESTDATFGAFCMVVRPGEGVVPRYLGLVMRSPRFLTAMRRAARATNNIANIRKGHVEDFEFFLPSEAEQRRIVAEYEMQRGELLAGIASIREASELLVTLEGSIIDEAIALAADHAETTRLGDVVEKLTSGSRDWKPYYGSGSGVFVLAQNVRSRRLDFRTVLNVEPPENDPARVRSAVERDDVLVTIVGAGTGTVARVDSDLVDHWVCQSVALIRPNKELVDGRYLELFLSAPGWGKARFAEEMYGQGRPHLSFAGLKSIELPLPPVDVQTRLVETVTERLGEVDLMRAETEGALADAALLDPSLLSHALGRGGSVSSGESRDVGVLSGSRR